MMMVRNAIFTKAGVKNITDFKKKWHLAMPHICILVDEFQTMYKNAAKKKNEINNLIDLVARLGRNTGVHLILASQELGSDVDKGMLGNIGNRLCLGCLPQTSEQILGNSEASTYFGQKGRLIINRNPGQSPNIDLNIHLRTPFLPSERLTPTMKSLFDYLKFEEDLAKAIKQSPFYSLSFYDEDAMIYEDDFKEYVRERSTESHIYIGEPSFVLRYENGEQEKWLRIELKRSPAENVLVFTSLEKNRKIFLKSILYNLKGCVERNPNAGIQILCYYGSEEFMQGIDVGIFTKTMRVRQYTPELENMLNSVKWRRLAVDADTLAFEGIKLVDEDMEVFSQLFESSTEYQTDVYKRRAQAIMSLVRKDYATAFSWTKANDEQTIRTCIGVCFAQYAKLGCKFKRLLPQMFPMTYIFVTSLEVITGIGRDSKMKNVDALKSIILDSSEYNIIFVVSTSTMEDCGSMRSAFSHMLLDQLQGSMIAHVKLVDHMPDTVAPILGVYYCATLEKDKARKFKKFKFENEL